MFSILLKEETYSFNPTGASTGIIYLKFDQLNFPDNVWSDFPDVIIHWWLEGLNQMLTTKEEGFYIMNFMDGPCAWIIEYSQSKIITIQCKRHDKVEFTFQINIVSLIQEVLQVSNNFLRFCHSKGYTNEDIQIVSSQYKTLSKGLKKLLK